MIEITDVTPKHHPAVSEMLENFAFGHLPPDLAAVSKPFCELAHALPTMPVTGAELTVCLRKLLEAKDCAVRAHLAWKRQQARRAAADGPGA